ncbi:MAG: hypothetical protein HRU30_00750 [Rhodobacteraceae bacterium]|nr:hypothetical protein [Paracoccaceae bacterium]
MDKKLLSALILAAAMITGCADDTQVANKSSRNFHASKAAISEARKVAEICARHAPDGSRAIASLKSVGFKESPNFTKERSESVPKPSGKISLEYLEKRNLGLVVYVFSHIPADNDHMFLDNFYCSIAVQNMSAEQASLLSKTWIDRFEATEDDLFRGVHVQNQILEFQALTEGSQIQIHILQSTSHIEGRGTAVALRYQERGRN